MYENLGNLNLIRYKRSCFEDNDCYSDAKGNYFDYCGNYLLGKAGYFKYKGNHRRNLSGYF